MKVLKGEAELHITIEALQSLLTHALNDEVFRVGMDAHEVIDVDIQRDKAYPVVLTIAQKEE